jgi:glycosyltransferase involved in cell wall biosynthesis
MNVPVIVIVTPTLNSEVFLDQTISSIVSQAGHHYIRFHLQDGGSIDNTIGIAERWKYLLEKQLYPIGCLGVEMSIASQSDGSMYEAINRGFSAALRDDATLMGWINSDDLLAPGSMATAVEIVEANPQVSWLGGRAAILSENNCIVSVDKPRVFKTQNLANGVHDGRRLSFVMQEGTYWRPALWRHAGGLDGMMKFAGDWDLWRRFARFSQYTSVDSVLGFHRIRRGQLTESLEPYYAEVDAALSQWQPIRVASDRLLFAYFDSGWRIIDGYRTENMNWMRRLNRQRLDIQRRFFWDPKRVISTPAGQR